MSTITNTTSSVDEVIEMIADYILDSTINSELAYETAHYCLWDAMACAFSALTIPACTKLLGPIVPNTQVPAGVRVIGTQYQLDPVKAAFDIGTLIRWLDHNDTWLAAEWGHPSDNLGAILACADYVSQREAALTMHDILTLMIKAYEIQGIFALENSFNQVGLDHVILVKLASIACVTPLLGGDRTTLMNAISQVFVDGQSLRTYRHAPNATSRKSWAAGDATSRAVQLALFSLKGEAGFCKPLSAKRWGFYDVLFKGRPFEFSQPFNSYVMENILFKISYPAEFHAQTAAECALKLHPLVKDKHSQIERIEIQTHKSAMDIIVKDGPLQNPADRDHCLQYIAAVMLLDGHLTAKSYETSSAKRPEIDNLRALMQVSENPEMTNDYYDPTKRSIANAIQIFFKDGTSSDCIRIDYPLGHRRRRKEGMSALIKKCHDHIRGGVTPAQFESISALIESPKQMLSMSFTQWMDLLIKF